MLEWLTELRRTGYSCFLVSHEGYNSLTGDGRDARGGRQYGEGCTDLPCLLREPHPSDTLMCSPTQKPPEPVLRVFMEGLWLIKSWAIGD